MVYEGGIDWLHANFVMELAINNRIQDSTGLSTVYIVCGTPVKMPMDMLEGFHGSTTGT